MSARPATIGHNKPLTPTLPQSRLRLFFPMLLIASIVVGVAVLVEFLGDAVRFPVSRVEVGGKVVYLDKTQLMRIVKKHTQRGFYGLSISDVREEVIALPWVKDALVRRVLPDRLHINVIERSPAKQWNDTGLIDSEGEVFYPPQLNPEFPQLVQWQTQFSDLPHLRGGDERSLALQETFETYKNALRSGLPKLQGLYEDDRRSQTLQLEGGIIVRLGYEETLERLSRFSKLFPNYLNEDSARELQFDMRYTNGFAVAKTVNNVNTNTGYN